MVFGIQEVCTIQESYMIWKKEQVCILNFFVLSGNACNFSLNLIGEKNV